MVGKLTESLSAGLDFVLGSVLFDILEHFVVVGALDGSLNLLQVVGVVQHLVPLGVEVADLADVLLALAVGHGAVTLTHLGVVLHDLDRLQVRLELEQVGHDARRCLTQLRTAEREELLQPDLVKVVLDLKHRFV